MFMMMLVHESHQYSFKKTSIWLFALSDHPAHTCFAPIEASNRTRLTWFWFLVSDGKVSEATGLKQRGRRSEEKSERMWVVHAKMFTRKLRQ